MVGYGWSRVALAVTDIVTHHVAAVVARILGAIRKRRAVGPDRSCHQRPPTTAAIFIATDASPPLVACLRVQPQGSKQPELARLGHTKKKCIRERWGPRVGVVLAGRRRRRCGGSQVTLRLFHHQNKTWRPSRCAVVTWAATATPSCMSSTASSSLIPAFALAGEEVGIRGRRGRGDHSEAIAPSCGGGRRLPRAVHGDLELTSR